MILFLRLWEEKVRLWSLVCLLITEIISSWALRSVRCCDRMLSRSSWNWVLHGVGASKSNGSSDSFNGIKDVSTMPAWYDSCSVTSWLVVLRSTSKTLLTSSHRMLLLVLEVNPWFTIRPSFDLGCTWCTLCGGSLRLLTKNKNKSVPESWSRRATLSCWFLLVRLLWVVILLGLQYQTWDDRDLVFLPKSSLTHLWQNTPIQNGEMCWQYWLCSLFVDMILLIVATSHNMERLAKEEESECIGGISNEPGKQPCFSPCFLVGTLKILLTRRMDSNTAQYYLLWCCWV